MDIGGKGGVWMPQRFLVVAPVPNMMLDCPRNCPHRERALNSAFGGLSPSGTSCLGTHRLPPLIVNRQEATWNFRHQLENYSGLRRQRPKCRFLEGSMWPVFQTIRHLVTGIADFESSVMRFCRLCVSQLRTKGCANMGNFVED